MKARPGVNRRRARSVPLVMNKRIRLLAVATVVAAGLLGGGCGDYSSGSDDDVDTGADVGSESGGSESDGSGGASDGGGYGGGYGN